MTGRTINELIFGAPEETVLASAIRAATNNSPEKTNFNAKGIFVVFDITVVPGTDTVQLIVQAKDPASGKYIDLFVDGTQVATTTRTVIIYPAALTAADGIDATRDYPLPRTYRIRIVHSAASNFTYSVGTSLIN